VSYAAPEQLVTTAVNAVNASTGLCGYQATCTAGGRAGVCVSIGSGCCGGGTVTAGLCPGKQIFLIRIMGSL
jgi:hypothetical protein